MNRKNTWLWFMVAALLFAVIVFERYTRQPDTGPVPVFPNLKASAVTNVQVFPAGQLEIRAERANSAWLLTKPISYPAQAAAIESLLAALEQLTPATFFSAHELRQHPNADEEFGFDAPQASLVIQGPDCRIQVRVGRRTQPGDQVYLQVVGVTDVYVVDADWLKLLPQTMTGWRDTSLLDLRSLAFDRLTVTNGANSLELQRDAAGNLWRLTRPIPDRGDNDRIAGLLQKLQALRVVQFIPDDPKPDLGALGLQPADLALAFGQGTNIVAVLEFGKSPTNDPNLVYARRPGLNAIVTVAKESLAPWRGSVNGFRDPYLVSPTAPLDHVEIRGADNFIVQRAGTNAWRIATEPFPVDAGLVNEALLTLAAMRVEFFKDAVTEPDLAANGLKPPTRQIILWSVLTNAAGPTNLVIADLSFGTNQEGRVFVRRAPEDFIYEVKPADFQHLPAASWQLRDRRIWSFTESEAASLTIRQDGKVRQLVRNGPNQWAPAPGSPGMIDDVASAAIEEAVHRLGGLSAGVWVARGDQDRARYGFKEGGRQISIELKTGVKFSVEFGGVAPSQYPYAAVTLDGRTWIFEFPLALYYEFVLRWLGIPAGVP